MTNRRGGVLLAVLLCAISGCAQLEDVGGPEEPEPQLADKGYRRINGFRAMNGFTPFNGFRSLNGLRRLNGLNVTNGNVAHNGSTALNGMDAWNGLRRINGLRAKNGLTAFNGMRRFNGLSAAANLVTDLVNQGSSDTASYVVKCALRPDQSAFGFQGELGVCPEYATESIASNVACQEKISSCLMALTNYHGEHVQVELRSPIPSIGTESTNTGYTIQEGRYFGNFWGENPEGFFCVKRKDASIWRDYVAVPRMCEYTDGTWNNDFWNGGTPASNWMMDKCAYAIVGICEDICTDWSCTWRGKTYDHPIEVWRYGGTNSYATPKVNRAFVLHYGGLPVVPSSCKDDTNYETHGLPHEGGYRSCADYTDRSCDEISDVWGQSAIQNWELKHECPRACKMPQTCSVAYEAEHALAQVGTEPKDDTRAQEGAYVAFGSGGSLSFANVVVSKAAQYNIAVRFNTNDRWRAALALSINGERRAATRLARVKDGQWAVYTFTEQLREGQNAITLQSVGTDSVNIDAFVVSPLDFSASTGTVALSKTRLSGADGSITTYSFDVPSHARGLNVSVYNHGYDATPDLDVFVRQGSEPSTSYQDPDYCRSPFGDEEGRPCSFSSADRPLGGTWYVKVKGWGNYGGGNGDGWELKATYY